MTVLRALLALVVGTLLSLTAATSVIVLGWLMRLMRGRALVVAGQPAERPGWLLGGPQTSGLRRLFGGLSANLREGLGAAIVLFIATLPFAGFWLVSWWAGWENSFHKGYEQAFVGPAIGFAGVAIFAMIMLYLPMALAHQATEARSFAFFELRRVRSVVRHTGWGYVIWAVAMFVLSLPIFASRGLPVFAEGIHPAVADMGPEAISNLRLGIDLATAAYVLVVLVYLKRWSATIYARAAMRASGGRDAKLWQGAAIKPGQDASRPFRLTRFFRTLALFAIWVAFAFVIFFGQFLHHDWWVWLNHPLVFLPWSP